MATTRHPAGLKFGRSVEAARTGIRMIQNRELTIDDYLAIVRRRAWVIIIPALLGPAIALGISFFFSPKYTSETTVLVQGQKVPDKYVMPITSEDVMLRVTALEQQVLGRNRLQPMVERLGILRSGDNPDEVLDDIRRNLVVAPVNVGASAGTPRRAGADVPGFTLSFTWSDPKLAQQLCSQLTSMLLAENLKSREQVAQGTTEFLSRQVEEAKNNLDEQDAKLASFKRQYVGQLPGDEDNNLKILMGLNSQLDANTQALNRAQQDKSFAESVLSQQLGAWKASQSTTSPEALQQQLTTLQSQLIQLEARYTADHPDVVKTKADIAELQKKLAEVNSAKPDPANDRAGLAEPPEIRQLRVQIHQYQEAIAQAGKDQKRLQDQIKLYQGRVALSPVVEEQYKRLTRDYNTAQKFYDDLLAKKSQSEMTTDMERQQEGEQFYLLNPATLPSSPSFPNRWSFAGAGLGIGLVVGLGLAWWFEIQDKAIRNESDLEAVMQLPVLVSVPWVVGEELENKNGKKKAGSSSGGSDKEMLEV
jgi:polysaccharide chain length determinant protein (PEP-CTERM system associated)